MSFVAGGAPIDITTNGTEEAVTVPITALARTSRTDAEGSASKPATARVKVKKRFFIIESPCRL